MTENRLDQYLNEIGRTPLLTEEQEQQLSVRALKGDSRAINKLVEANLRLVVTIARQYQGQGADMDDLISEGNIGLMKAAEKYDATRGLRFAGYAVPRIRQQIEKSLPPTPSQREEDKHIVSPSHGGDGRKSLSSLDAPLGIKPNMSLLSVLADSSQPATDSRLYSGTQLEMIERALNGLNERESRVITAYFGIGQDHATMAEIAADMGLKRERVRQIRDRAVRRIKTFLKQQ